MIWMDNTTGHARMGLIVPKFQSTAVARNRIRRRLREIWRLELQPPSPRGTSSSERAAKPMAPRSTPSARTCSRGGARC